MNRKEVDKRRKNRKKKDDLDEFIIVWLIKTGRPMRVKRRTALKLVKKGKAMFEEPEQVKAKKLGPKSFRIIQLIETGEIIKLPDAEAAKLVEEEKAGYVL